MSEKTVEVRRQQLLDQFEAFCTVTQSVGQGIPIGLTVRDVTGAQLKPVAPE